MGIVTRQRDYKKRAERPNPRPVDSEDKELLGYDDDVGEVDMGIKRDGRGARMLIPPEWHQMQFQKIAEEKRRHSILMDSKKKWEGARPWMEAVNKESKWHIGRCEEFYNILTHPEGAHGVESAAGVMGISRMTIYAWIKDHPEFALAVEAAKVAQEEMFAGRLARGMPYSQGLVWVLKNKHNWTDKVQSVLQLSIAEVIAKQEGEARYVDWEHPNLDAIDAPQNAAQIEAMPSQGSQDRRDHGQAPSMPEVSQDAAQGQPQGEAESEDEGTPEV